MKCLEVFFENFAKFSIFYFKRIYFLQCYFKRDSGKVFFLLSFATSLRAPFYRSPPGDCLQNAHWHKYWFQSILLQLVHIRVPHNNGIYSTINLFKINYFISNILLTLKVKISMRIYFLLGAIFANVLFFSFSHIFIFTFESTSYIFFIAKLKKWRFLCDLDFSFKNIIFKNI